MYKLRANKQLLTVYNKNACHCLVFLRQNCPPPPSPFQEYHEYRLVKQSNISIIVASSNLFNGYMLVSKEKRKGQLKAITSKG